jgi:Domain of unknown function (DUF4189)
VFLIAGTHGWIVPLARWNGLCVRPVAVLSFGRFEEDRMRRAITIATVLLGLGWVLVTAEPALAQYGAIAWDKETGKYGASWNKETQKGADEVALSDCGASGCRIVRRVAPKMCGALALSADGKMAGAAFRKDRDAARVAALAACPKKAGECTVRVTECNK